VVRCAGRALRLAATGKLRVETWLGGGGCDLGAGIVGVAGVPLCWAAASLVACVAGMPCLLQGMLQREFEFLEGVLEVAKPQQGVGNTSVLCRIRCSASLRCRRA